MGGLETPPLVRPEAYGPTVENDVFDLEVTDLRLATSSNKEGGEQWIQKRARKVRAIAFRTKCDVKGSVSGGPSATVSCRDFIAALGGTEDIKSTDFGILVGGGVAVGGFMAQVAFDYGLTTLDAETDPLDIKNQAFYALVGWMFRLN